MRRSLTALAGLWFLLSAGSLAAANKKWVEVDSPHFHVFTDGSESDARQMAFELEQLRYVFASRFPKVRLNSGAPLFVFGAVDKDTEFSLLPALKKTKGGNLVAGEYFSDWEKQYAVVRLDDRDARAMIVYHEYVHSILHMNAIRLPAWLDEGLSEFYAYTRFDGRDIYLGALSVRYPLLRGNTLTPIEKLITSPVDLSAGVRLVNLYYAESWALVHFLTFGPGMGGGAKLSRFVALLQTGVDQKTAFQQVFGGFEEMNKEFRKYVLRFAFPALRIETPSTLDKKNFTARVLSEAETDAHLAAFHIWTGDLDGAIPLAQAAVSADPKLGLAHEDMGYALFSQGKDAAAEQEFDQAYSLDGSLYLSLFAKTMMSPIARSNTPVDEAQAESALQKVLQLNPQFAPADVQLALLAVRQGDLQGAFEFSRRAEALAPGRAEYHLLTGRILLRMGRDADAARFAQYVADRWPLTDHDEAVALWDQIPAAQRPAGVTISADFPKGVRIASGTILSQQCSEKPANYKIVIQTGGHSMTFQSSSGFPVGFSDTLWYGQDHFTFCHHLEGLQAVVFYHPASGAGSDGKIAELEIRDNFPAPAPDKAASAAGIGASTAALGRKRQSSQSSPRRYDALPGR